MEDNWMTAPGEWRRTSPELLVFPDVDTSEPYQRLELKADGVGVFAYLLRQGNRLTLRKAPDENAPDPQASAYWFHGFWLGIAGAVERGETIDEVWDMHTACWAAGKLRAIR